MKQKKNFLLIWQLKRYNRKSAFIFCLFCEAWLRLNRINDSPFGLSVPFLPFFCVSTLRFLSPLFPSIQIGIQCDCNYITYTLFLSFLFFSSIAITLIDRREKRFEGGTSVNPFRLFFFGRFHFLYPFWKIFLPI